ncbi:MAG: WxPxxD family membrane protein [Bacillota bacterium]
MNYNMKNFVSAFIVLTLYLIISFYILNQIEIAEPNNRSLIAITTNPFSYYDLRTVVYVYSIFFLLIINLVLNKNSIYILRLGNRNSITKVYFTKVLGLSFVFVIVHSIIGALLTTLFFGIEIIYSNKFLLLSIIYASVLFLYFLIIALILSLLEVFFSINTSLILSVIIIISCYFLNNVFWTPILDTRIFGMAYLDIKGLNIQEITRIYIRQIAIISMLLIIQSIVIQRKDYFE